jgi:hypothetical protein
MKTKPNELNGNRLRSLRRHPVLCLLAAALAVGCVGCGEKAKVAEQVNPAGVYTLVSVDGKNVPCTVSHQGHEVDVKSGVFTINAEGTCSSDINFSIPSGGENRRAVKATYTLERSTLTMKWEGAGMTIGTVEGDTFTMNNEGMIFSYRRQAKD